MARFPTRLLCSLILLLLFLSACRGGTEPDVPTLVPTVATGEDGDSPRGSLAEEEATPDHGLPPTWTPPPTSELPPTAEPPTPPPTRETYVIRPGDTLAEIAIRFGVALDALARENNISDIDRIEVNQVLVIPLP